METIIILLALGYFILMAYFAIAGTNEVINFHNGGDNEK